MTFFQFLTALVASVLLASPMMFNPFPAITKKQLIILVLFKVICVALGVMVLMLGANHSS